MWLNNKPCKEKTYFEILNLPVGEYTPEEVSKATVSALARAKRMPEEIDRVNTQNEILDTFFKTQDGIGSEYIDSIKEKDAKQKPFIKFMEFIINIGGSIGIINSERVKQIGSDYTIKTSDKAIKGVEPNSSYSHRVTRK